MYLQADVQLKEQALAKTTATQARVSRYRPPDRVLAFLNTLQLFRQLRTHQRAILQEIELLRSHCRNNPLAGIMPEVVYARPGTIAVTPQSDLSGHAPKDTADVLRQQAAAPLADEEGRAAA